MKIYITGGPGSGKTTYAKTLSSQYNVPHFDLDYLNWAGVGEHMYDCKRDKAERAEMLQTILNANHDWICEGVYFGDWVMPMLSKVDKVIILQTPRYIRHLRCLKRFVARKLGIEKTQGKESFSAMLRLLKWNQQYDKEYLPMVLDKLKQRRIDYEIV